MMSNRVNAFIYAVCCFYPSIAARAASVDEPFIWLDRSPGDNAIVDLGEVSPFGVVQRSITLRNGSDSDIIISEVRPECGCTKASCSKMALSPGSSAKLTVEVRGRGYVEDISTRVVVVGLRGVQKFATTCSLHVAVKDLIHIDSPDELLDLGIANVREGDVVKAFDLSVGASSIPWDIVTAELSDNNGFSIELNSSGGGHWIALMHVRNCKVFGRRSGDVIFHFIKDGHQLANSTIRHFSVYVDGGVEISPPSLFFPTVARGSTLHRSLEISSKVDTSVSQIVRVNVPPVSGLTCRTVDDPTHLQPSLDVEYAGVGGPNVAHEGVIDVVVLLGQDKVTVEVPYISCGGS